jgi:surfeit locus 1 family protein
MFNLQSLTAVGDFTYRKVFMKGKWDHAHAMLFGPRVHEGTSGYHLVEPLIRTDGTTVLIDRGFISKDQVDHKTYLNDVDEVEVLGMLRTGHVRNSFTPENRPEEGKWYWSDIEAMTEYAGGEAASVQPVYIEEIFGP